MVATAYPDRRDGVPTPAHTLGDDSLLIKYINPRLFAFATLTSEEDGVNGGGDAGDLNGMGQDLTVGYYNSCFFCLAFSFFIGVRIVCVSLWGFCAWKACVCACPLRCLLFWFPRGGGSSVFRMFLCVLYYTSSVIGLVCFFRARGMVWYVVWLPVLRIRFGVIFVSFCCFFVQKNISFQFWVKKQYIYLFYLFFLFFSL